MPEANNSTKADPNFEGSPPNPIPDSSTPGEVRDLFNTLPVEGKPRNILNMKSPQELRDHLARLGLVLPVDDKILTTEEGSPLADPITIGGFTIGNRWCIHPMEGWDGTKGGGPGENTIRRWERIGLSGAKLAWGEATAVQHDGRANAHQLMATPDHVEGLALLLKTLKDAHGERFGTIEDLLVGLQLTHSGRFCRPNGPDLEPRIACHHPLLDEMFGIDPNDDSVVWTDEDLEILIDAYVDAAKTAQQAGFQFVDIKACHGYLFHGFLSAHTRPGEFGGDFDGRTRLLLTTIDRVRSACPDLIIGTRLSAFDTLPHQPGKGPMDPKDNIPYNYGFGINQDDPTKIDLTEPIRLIKKLRDHGVSVVNISAGSPYYNPDVQRPTTFKPFEDPLIDVCRQISFTRECKKAVPDMPMVGTGYTCLGRHTPHVGQAVVREGWTDFVGLGRQVLSCPQLPADALEKGKLDEGQLCCTCGACTVSARSGLTSGCYTKDPHYRDGPDGPKVKELMAEALKK